MTELPKTTHSRLSLSSASYSKTNPPAGPVLTGVKINGSSLSEVNDTRKTPKTKGDLVPAITARVGAFSSAIKSAIEHGDIRINEDGSVEVRSDYLHPKLIAAARFRRADYDKTIREPEEDHIFHKRAEFPVRVRKRIIKCLVRKEILASEDVSETLVDAVIFVVREIVENDIMHANLGKRLKSKIRDRVTGAEITVFDHQRGYQKQIINASFFKPRRRVRDDSRE